MHCTWKPHHHRSCLRYATRVAILGDGCEEIHREPVLGLCDECYQAFWRERDRHRYTAHSWVMIYPVWYWDRIRAAS